MITPRRVLALAGASVAVAFFPGCVSEIVQNPAGVPVSQMKPDEAGFVSGTGIESQDLVTVTDRMARGIVGIPEIAHAKSTPHIVLEPVVNNTRFPIDKDIFLTRIRVMLNSKAMNKVRFLDRAMMARFQEEQQIRISGELTSAAVPAAPRTGELRGADYFLTGQLDGMTTKTSAGTGDYVLYSFRLTDARTSEIVWEDSYEIKKEGLEDAAYR
jgi:PBP1b-binding outer membrane lipoprotein LpoB